MKFKISEFFGLPNLLCYFRMILIPIFVLAYLQANEPKDYHIAAFILFLSGLTDYLDGFIARKYNMITEWGKVIDPIADKLTQIAVVIVLFFKIKYMYILVFIFVIKELFMAGAGLFLLKKGKKVNGALWWGKVSTAVFYLAMFLIIALPRLSEPFVNTLIFLSSFFMLVSFWTYAKVYWKMYKE